MDQPAELPTPPETALDRARREAAEMRISPAEREAAGRALRKTVPRSAHGDWAPAADRPDPLALIGESNRSRLPEYVPIRWGRMLASPFGFLRGSAAVMARDLVGSPVTGIPVQACGDCHVLNFGIFGTRERNLVFGINDFDETLPGPWEWDVKRLAASALIAGRYIGASEPDAQGAARAAARSYREHMHEYSRLGYLERFYTYLDTEHVRAVLRPEMQRRALEFEAKARQHTNVQVLEKTTELIDGDFRIVESPPLVVHVPPAPDVPDATSVLTIWLRTYRASLPSDRRELLSRYRVIDAVRKVVGVGSVGTRCFVVLLRGYDERDPLFLQVKEAQPSVLEPYLRRSGHRNHGQRVVAGQRLIQPAPDIFLGWGRVPLSSGRDMDFYVRQLRDMKGSVTAERGVTRPAGLIEYAGLCGWALALAHARSGDASMIAGYLGTSETIDESVVRFAVAYSDQTERDHEALVKAVKAGRIEAVTGQ